MIGLSFRKWAGLSALLLVLTVIGAACATGANANLRHYYHQLDGYEGEYKQLANPAIEQVLQVENPDQPNEETLAALREMYSTSIVTFGDWVAAIESIAPPPQVAPLHDKYVNAFASGAIETQLAYMGILSQLENAQSVPEALQIIGATTSPTGAGSEAEVRVACQRLVSLAEQNDIVTTLVC